MRLRLLVFAWLLSAVTNAEEVESVSESPELAEEAGMVSSKISKRFSDKTVEARFNFDSPQISGGYLVSNILTSEDDKCTQIEVLWWAGIPKLKIEHLYEQLISASLSCLKSEDGSPLLSKTETDTYLFTDVSSTKTGTWRRYPKDGDNHPLVVTPFSSRSKSEELSVFNEQLLSTSASQEQLINMQEFCDTSGCQFTSLIALLFAKANRNELDGKRVTAAMYRLKAFDALDLNSLPEHMTSLIEGARFKDGLTLHAQALIKYSFDTEDYQIANEAKYILTRLEALDTETEARLNEWDLNLEGAVTPISVTLPLVADTPVSKYHYAVSKGLALKEFGITTDGVDLAYAFLHCSEKQVTLVTAARSAWVISDDWEDCRLTLLSDEPTKATITEYPDGYVDRNGSLII